LGEVEIGRAFRGDLVTELLRQMTRAGLTFEDDAQRELSSRLSIAQIKEQTDMYREAADRLYPPGRITEPVIERRHVDAPTAHPATVQG
jgi:hypothetical protein